MTGMARWAVLVPAEQYAVERLFAHESVPLPERPGVRPAPGDPVLLIAVGDEPMLFGLGRVRTAHDGCVVQYTHRLFDAPLPTPDLRLDVPGPHELDAKTFDTYAAAVGAELRVDGPKQEWLVSVDLPIEAASPAEAVRAFWSYVEELGPRELPAFVTPVGDELAMQAFVLGEPVNLDPEEDDE